LSVKSRNWATQEEAARRALARNADIIEYGTANGSKSPLRQASGPPPETGKASRSLSGKVRSAAARRAKKAGKKPWEIR